MKSVHALLVGATLAVSALASTSASAGSSYGTCYAYTACPYGGMISCQVYGQSSAGVACTWGVVPGRAVQCSGFDGYGNWVNVGFTCPGT